MNLRKTAAVVIGGYVNGYSVIQELHGRHVEDIILFSYGDRNQIAENSRLPKKIVKISNDDNSLKTALQQVHREYDYIVPFPTNDNALEGLCRFRNEIKDFCFLPFNPTTLPKYSSKLAQYEACDRCGVPRPKTCQLKSLSDWSLLDEMALPIIIKPTTRIDILEKVFAFRNRVFYTRQELMSFFPLFRYHMIKGNEFLASELVPGPSAGRIFAYTAYCTDGGHVVNGWGGCKLSQTPDDYGVFSTGSNNFPDEVEVFAKQLFKETEAKGLVQAEFKESERDGKFYLMEINFRSDMWNRVGTLCGVNNAYSMWCEAVGREVSSQDQERRRKVVFCNLLTELINLGSRPKYWPLFKHCVFGRAKRHFVFLDCLDLKVNGVWILKILNVIRKQLWARLLSRVDTHSSQKNACHNILSGTGLRIGEGCKFHGDIHIGKNVTIGGNTTIGMSRNSSVAENDEGNAARCQNAVVIGNDVEIGEGTKIFDGVVIYDGAVIKKGCLVKDDVYPG